ncbi:MAG: oxygen-dependent coproporphyrinogen oxidase [archaeon]|nr:oxygen-dependent coproporphyrinogen oxidase [archaeon]
MSADQDGVSLDEIQERMRGAQRLILEWAVEMSGQQPRVDEWEYHKGSGGGTTIVWEDGAEERFFEKGGVNWSGLVGKDMPASAVAQMKIPAGTGFQATGVSLVMHPHNPHVPTVHMNVRYFQADAAADCWWFGGGIDVTPVFPRLEQVVGFHRALKALCERHGHSYGDYKALCDEYFYLKHRKETRGVGGIFFEGLHPRKNPSWTKRLLLDFVIDLANSFPALYQPFSANHASPYSADQREFQLWRRSRYVEFNLLFDRGTKFGIESEGRTESILMSLPAVCNWKYGYAPPAGTPEAASMLYLKPQDWLQITDESQLV